MTIQLPLDLEKQAEEAAALEGVDIDTFVRVAVAEKIRGIIQSTGKAATQSLELEPLPVLEGFLPPGWKDAVYSRP